MATERAMTEPAIKRNVCFVLLGVVALALKAPYSGPLADAVQCWGGNVSASFAVYFVIAGSILGRRLGRLAAATIALLAVQLFEVTNGFGLMTNVYRSCGPCGQPGGGRGRLGDRFRGRQVLRAGI